MSKINNRFKNSNYQTERLPEWDVAKIEAFFNSKELPKTIDLDEVTHITDVPKFINRHISYLKSNNGTLVYEPYLIRLRLLATKI